MTISQWLMPAILALAALLIARSLFKRDKSDESRINLEDLLLGADGRASKAAFIMFGAFTLSSWVVVYQTMSGTLSDLTFGAYLAAWVAPTVTALIVNGGQVPNDAAKKGAAE